MTVCLYVSPPFDINDPDGNVRAALAADIMVTYTLQDRQGRRIDNNPARTPSTATPATFHNPVSTVLTRKLNIIGPCAIACASNDGDAIRDVVLRVESELDGWIDAGGERPLLELRHLLTNGNNLRAAQGLPVVESLAISEAPDQRIHRVFPTRGGITRTFRHFGYTHAIGTGANTIMGMIESFENSVDEWPAGVHPESKIEGLMKYINGLKISEEIKFGPREGWGGYLEWAYLRPDEDRWRRGGPMLYVTTVVSPTADGTGEVRVLDRVVGYDPERMGGCVFSLGDGGIMVFPLQRIIGDAPPITDFFSSFQGWQPESCMLTTIPSFGPPGPHLQSYCRWEDVDYMDFAILEDRVQMGFRLSQMMIDGQRDGIRRAAGSLATADHQTDQT